MSRRPPSLLAASLGSLLLLACQREAVRPDPAPGSASPSAPAVVATVGTDVITADALDRALEVPLRQLEAKYAQERYELRRKQLEQLVDDRLLQAEARRRGVTVEALLKAEVHDPVGRPAEADIRQVFEQSAPRLPPGSTLEQYRGEIVEVLRTRAKEARVVALLERLRKEHYVRVRLSPPRTRVEARGPSQGPADAKVTIVEFLDFECPYCARAHDTLRAVMEKYAGRVRRVFRNYPLSFHPHAQQAAEAALCADAQGRFWEYQDALFSGQGALDEEGLKAHAAAVGLEAGAFAECLRSRRFARVVQADMEAANQAGVSGTPAYFVNGIMLSGAQPLEAFERVIEQELAGDLGEAAAGARGPAPR